MRQATRSSLRSAVAIMSALAVLSLAAASCRAPKANDAQAEKLTIAYSTAGNAALVNLAFA
jgi:hypothetical protein